MVEQKILLIYTGGTIGMLKDEATGTLKSVDFSNLMQEIPELKKFDFTIDIHSFEKPIDSSNMHPSIWQTLVGLIESNYNDYDGFVILHGSDTMAYTASALSFMIQNLAKPVILTGSQLPIGTIRTDAKENLITAVEIASTKKDDKPLIAEVCIYFEYQLYRGNRTHKYNAEHFQAFRSSNYPILAQAGLNIVYKENAIAKASESPLKVYTELCNDIGVLMLFPGISKKILKSYLEIEGLKALIILTFGSGNTTTESWFIDELENAINKGLIIVNVSQCTAGSVEQGKYETSAMLEKIGVLSGKDITIESAITKLMHLLGNYSIEETKTRFCKPISGEMI